ncbi:MAG: 1-acyl-sn-glycerol-3-phosphate acyltransferase [Akkermansiaceae bacterium]|nr:1-acyl-sn-glycerol-3-phosphate acyltransferase [Armatimonadota bacterium]
MSQPPPETAPDLPPIDERVLRVVNLAYSRVLRMRERVTGIRFAAPDDEIRLRALKGKRVLFLPNHPTVMDPPVMFGLSRMLEEPFRYVAMAELFEGAVGALVKRIGAFPVRRGMPDRAALKKCQASLLTPGGKLVMFAEGEAHGQNDYLLPLNPGFAQVAFWAVEKLQEAEGAGADILLQPVAIKYRFVDADDARRQITDGLEKVEHDLGITSEHNASLYRRTRDAALTILAGIEQEYDIPLDADADTDDRLGILYSCLEARVVAMLRAPVPKETNMVHRMRTLFNGAYAYREKMDHGETRYSHRLQERREWIADACLADLRRVENFMGVREKRLEADATLEQISEMLVRLEVELYGDRRTRPLRDATIAMAEPFSASERFPAYQADKRKAVADVTADVETRLRALLDGLQAVSTLAI